MPDICLKCLTFASMHGLLNLEINLAFMSQALMVYMFQMTNLQCAKTKNRQNYKYRFFLAI